MNRVKDDLVSEIIRVSQTNLLARKKTECGERNGDDIVMEWIRCNAASYRESYEEYLAPYSAVELGDMLNILTQSKKDLDEVLKKYPQH